VRVSARRLRVGLPFVLAVLAFVSGCRTVDAARVSSVSPDLGRLVLAGFTGTEGPGNVALERLLCEARVGGIILFGRNVVDPDQVAALTAYMRERARACTGRPLLVAVDAEGGQVMRLGPRAGYPATPSHQALGEANDLALTELEARRIARRLREAGITWNFAPVVDVGSNPANTVIVAKERSFSADAERVTAHARAYVRGMHAEGVLTALKHFPGHGSSFADSHEGFVDVTDTADPVTELRPYRALIADRLVDSVMTAHVVNRWIDPRYPATLSQRTITGVLRKKLGWRGVVVSDDLRMGAIERYYGMETAAVLALRAGVDVLLVADDRLPDGRSATTVILSTLRQRLASGRLDPKRLQTSLSRIRALAAKAG
jgi:beta-N-acetylhexosaminidase